jgi:hypothetical protein
MLKLFVSETNSSMHVVKLSPSLRGIRPSLLDLRFTGDAWVMEDEDGAAAVCLDNYRLAHIPSLPFDVPSLNRQFLELRQGQMRRRMYRQMRARRRRAALCRQC